MRPGPGHRPRHPQRRMAPGAQRRRRAGHRRPGGGDQLRRPPRPGVPSSGTPTLSPPPPRRATATDGWPCSPTPAGCPTRCRRRWTDHALARVLEALAIRRSVLDRVGGFRPDLRHSADVEWVARLGDLGYRPGGDRRGGGGQRLHTANTTYTQPDVTAGITRSLRLSILRKQGRGVTGGRGHRRDPGPRRRGLPGRGRPECPRPDPTPRRGHRGGRRLLRRQCRAGPCPRGDGDRPPPLGPGAARNRGAAHATTPLLAFLDGTTG